MKKKTQTDSIAKQRALAGKILRRGLLWVVTFLLLTVTGLALVLNLVFNGPSPTARDQLTMTLLEASATKWVPGLFIGEDRVTEIFESEQSIPDSTDNTVDTSRIIIQKQAPETSALEEWTDHPDGIRIEDVVGKTYTAQVMLVRDPARVYLGVSSPSGFSTGIPGKRLTEVMEEEGVLAAVNAGAFYDDGTSGPYVGSIPEGLVYSNGQCMWKNGAPPNGITGFAGFNKENILIVEKENISDEKAQALGIRDGCCFGPVLIINGEINPEAYNKTTGLNPRTAIGQRKDGAVIFVCINGRQAGSMGGEYADIIDIMVEYGAVNACNLDGGSSTVMMYRDTYGLYGEPGAVQLMNSYSLLQAKPRKMPDYWLVRPGETEQDPGDGA